MQIWLLHVGGDVPLEFTVAQRPLLLDLLHNVQLVIHLQVSGVLRQFQT